MSSPTDTRELAEIVNSGAAKPWRTWSIIVLIVLIAAGIFTWVRARNSEDAAKPVFVSEPLARGDLSVGITATGNLQPTNKVTVSSELSGICEAVYVDTNDEVKKDQQIAKLDTRKLDQTTAKTRATLAAAEARVNQAQASLRETTANLARLKDLHEISAGRTPSKAEMDTAIATADRAGADVENLVAAVSGAKADLRANESDLSKAIIRSPVDGVILTRSLEVGQTVAASFNAPELFVIAEDLRKMELLVAVAQADIGQVKSGQTASFTVEAWGSSRPYSAVLKKVSYGSTVLDNIVTYQAELEVSNDDLSLRPGMTATATIDVATRKDVLLVPAAALRFKPQDPSAKAKAAPEEKKTFLQSINPQPFRRRPGGGQRPGGEGGEGGGRKGPANRGRLWVLQNGKPVEIPVEIGLSDGRHTEVISDQLKENDAIIIRQIIAAPAP